MSYIGAKFLLIIRN